MAQEQTHTPVKGGGNPIQEKQTNCLACNKPIKKIRRYYRDGKFYCTKRCWKNYLEKNKAEAK
ncbi:MAG: hypothetical protein COT38_03245 [Candidatus Omnitrophica bacterium CG08_land_8_20_14_0_20_41_16]|uniref:TRASH domain-containing protein n=1 Tax=Candidatus Sherwoodlollariibacterium unditelluris TaxID=1974757 RepID=A0A2G9YKS1_9BACT|nr:MAG: hypothetical protein COX41_00715 [Candidatus Omnitrophica bacterium CG23_combo_of_CG06-09_8_20_14_all_41_10]PIS33841.1 MAG: hypothetical protein COT38_03245 [Candidatus Omnitrophica bacterium CG08_land_8_20_14_0_20_41_16]